MTRSRRSLVFAAAAGLSALGTARVARAQAPDPNVLYACYVPSTGTVYRIKAPGLPDQCDDPKGNKPPHVMFSWNVQGIQGPPGDPGPQGQAGANGVSGWVRAGNVEAPRTIAPGQDVSHTLFCPTGKKVLGGGADFFNMSAAALGGVVVRSMGPRSNFTWDVTVTNQGAASVTYTLAIFAICADVN